MSEHWSVTVSMNGREVVTIEPNMVAGMEVGKPEEEAIRTSAETLLSFIGDYPTAALTAKDAEIERLRADGRNWFKDIPKPTRKRASFSTAEKSKLRPIAETLAMLDGNAFFTMETGDGIEHYEWYLPEAHALYESNGGDNGWAGEASFAKAALTTETHERAPEMPQDRRSEVSGHGEPSDTPTGDTRG